MSERTTILVADDDLDDIFFLRRAFEKSGLNYSLMAVRDGQEAIDYLRGAAGYTDRLQFPLPRLLLLDLKMPRFNGFDVLTWLKKQPDFQQLPVVVLSSSGQDDDLQRARAMGADDYRVKPAEFDDLLKLAQELADHWIEAKHVSA
jgi:CheY-like chemotaxis protein